LALSSSIFAKIILDYDKNYTLKLDHMIRINTSYAKAMEITTFENTNAHFIGTLSENNY
jgi:hypothetical protein